MKAVSESRAFILHPSALSLSSDSTPSGPQMSFCSATASARRGRSRRRGQPALASVSPQTGETRTARARLLKVGARSRRGRTPSRPCLRRRTSPRRGRRAGFEVGPVVALRFARRRALHVGIDFGAIVPLWSRRSRPSDQKPRSPRRRGADQLKRLAFARAARARHLDEPAALGADALQHVFQLHALAASEGLLGVAPAQRIGHPSAARTSTGDRVRGLALIERRFPTLSIIK